VPEPKRLLVVLGSLGAGGSERQVIEIVRGLDRSRFLPSLFLVYRSGPLLAEVPGDVPVFAFAEAPMEPSPFHIPGGILWAQGRALARCVRDLDIDILYDRTSQMALTAYLAGRPRATARVSVAAGDPAGEFATAHHRFGRFKKILLRRAYRDADRVIAVSTGVARGLGSFYGLPSERIAVCPNLFDVDRIDALAAAETPERRAEHFRIVTVGRLQEEKGHIVLLEAIRRLVHGEGRTDIRLWLIGEGPSERTLRAFAAANRLEPFVAFLGRRANPLPWVRSADLFCLPSRYEGMPNALVEAMLCGTPIVATDCPSGPREILADGAYGTLVAPDRPEDLARAIGQARQDDADRRRVARAARRHAVEAYSARKGLVRLESALDEALATRRACRTS